MLDLVICELPSVRARFAQKLPFARRVASDFSVLEKGRVVASGPIEGLTDDVVKNHLTV